MVKVRTVPLVRTESSSDTEVNCEKFFKSLYPRTLWYDTYTLGVVHLTPFDIQKLSNGILILYLSFGYPIFFKFSVS